MSLIALFMNMNSKQALDIKKKIKNLIKKKKNTQNKANVDANVG